MTRTRAWLFSILIFASLVQSTAQAAQIRLYGANSGSALNRLHEVLFVRSGADGVEYGLDRVDPLYWSESSFLLQGKSLNDALSALTQVLNLPQSEIERLSLRQRAIVQRDLWAVFDSVSGRLLRPNTNQVKFLMALAAGIRKFALNQMQLNALANGLGLNYVRILKQAGWVEVGSQAAHPIGAAHVVHLAGRSTVIVLMRAGNTANTLSYLKALFEFPDPLMPRRNRSELPVLNPRIPQLPLQTQFVFARYANLIRSDGQIVATSIPEILQFSVLQKDGTFKFARAELSRANFFSGVKSGLRGITDQDEDFPQLLVGGQDPFENHNRWFKQNVIESCTGCHLGGLDGVESYVRHFDVKIKTSQVDPLVPQKSSIQFELTKAYKLRDPNWQRLRQILFR